MASAVSRAFYARLCGLVMIVGLLLPQTHSADPEAHMTVVMYSY